MIEFVKGLLNENFKKDKEHGGRWSADDAIGCRWIKSISIDLQHELVGHYQAKCHIVNLIEFR